jgi:hypothetical protein
MKTITITAPEYTVAIFATYHGPTNSRGSRVRIRVPEFRRGVTLPYDYGCGSAAGTALRWCAENSITVLYEAASTCDSEWLLIVAPESVADLRRLLD